MITPQEGAMIQGTQQGQQAGQQAAPQILPSAYQPVGRASPVNPWSGMLDVIGSKLLEISDMVGQQGNQYAPQKVKLLELSFKLAKINEEITKIASGDAAGKS